MILNSNFIMFDLVRGGHYAQPRILQSTCRMETL
jgi:hypothetical protein